MISDDDRPPGSTLEIPCPPLSEEMRQTLKSVGEFIERAREHHARTGEWPPDPLLDEVYEMRRRVLAEHGGDYRKLWASYVELGKQRAAQNGVSAECAEQGGVAGVSRP